MNVHIAAKNRTSAKCVTKVLHAMPHCGIIVASILVKNHTSKYRTSEATSLITSTDWIRLLCRCETCGSAFSQAAHLKNHAKVHSGEKPFKCEICTAAFADRFALKRHRRIHEKYGMCECTEIS